ncbi:hypothetical protein JL193_10595 [Polaribacter batillariae]|uniref:Peptidase E n=1 Tax=Polaribacter batillariae TaxID=2808900 RepID=A0ABX7SSS5_9FLAO|nr:DUF6702 family protein [Polaribacter batillariae]QTD36591.1 hypothetical protein JL193_10595 [Polaribacter batillariae]
MKQILVFLVFGLLSNAHPLKISTSKISTENDHLEIKIKLFNDDFTYLISQNYRLKQPVFTEAETLRATQLYFNKKLYVLQNNGKSFFEIKKSKYTKDSLAIEFHLKSEKPINKKKMFTINNTIFFESFTKQKNFMKFGNQSFETTISQPQATFNE